MILIGRLSKSRRCKLIKLTVDFVRDLLDEARPGYRWAWELVHLDETGVCEILCVTRITADIPDDPLRSRVAQLEICKRPNIPTVGQWDLSNFNTDQFASDDQVRECATLLQLLFPGAAHAHPKSRNRAADVGRLLGHKLSGRDVFVTAEKAFHAHKIELLRDFSIRIMSAEEAVQYVNEHS